MKIDRIEDKTFKEITRMLDAEIDITGTCWTTKMHFASITNICEL